MECPKCHKELPEASKFCPECGFNIIQVTDNSVKQNNINETKNVVVGEIHQYYGKEDKHIKISGSKIACGATIAILLVAVIGLAISNHKHLEEIETLSKETASYTSNTESSVVDDGSFENSDEEFPSDIQANAAVSDSDNGDGNFVEAELGKMYSVSADYGDFEVSIDSASKADARQWGAESNLSEGQMLVSVNCTANNINHSGIFEDGLHLYNYIITEDEDGYSREFYNLSASGNGEYQLDYIIPPGIKAKVGLLYIVPEDCKKIDVIINQEYIVKDISIK